MLKFLQTKNYQTHQRSLKKYHPEIYGISYQAPSQFQGKFTLIDSRSYRNPYQDIEPKRIMKIPQLKYKSLDLSSHKKTNPLFMQSQKIIGDMRTRQLNNKMYFDQKNHQKILDQSPHYFKISRGPFRDFLQKNHSYKAYGPLLGKQRSHQSIEKTKKDIYDQSKKNLNEWSKTLLRKNSIQYSFDSKISSNSIIQNRGLIFQKSKIRLERNNLNKQMHEEIKKRKSSQRLEIGPNAFPQISKIKNGKARKSATKRASNKYEISDLEQFQKMISKQ